MEKVSLKLLGDVGGVEFQRFNCKGNVHVCPFCSQVLNRVKKRSTGAYKVCRKCSCIYFIPNHLIKEG